MTAGAAERRRRAWRRGRLAESAAVLLLRLKGFRILARGYKVPVGEIDIIARRGRLVAFVEVKARASADAAAEALSWRQRRRIDRAARWFLSQHPDIALCELRYDLMLVTPWRMPVHIGDAWR
ncbi:MAG: YraN family protein [Rhodospirillales bacterium]|nr:YraN family protein [Rhodospirillales bacterium]